MVEFSNDIWPTDYYYIGEEVDYDCSVCGWSDATIVGVQEQPPKVILRHNGEKFVLYEDDYRRIDDKEYFGN